MIDLSKSIEEILSEIKEDGGLESLKSNQNQIQLFLHDATKSSSSLFEPEELFSILINLLKFIQNQNESLEQFNEHSTLLKNISNLFKRNLSSFPLLTSDLIDLFAFTIGNLLKSIESFISTSISKIQDRYITIWLPIKQMFLQIFQAISNALIDRHKANNVSQTIDFIRSVCFQLLSFKWNNGKGGKKFPIDQIRPVLCQLLEIPFRLKSKKDNQQNLDYLTSTFTSFIQFLSLNSDAIDFISDFIRSSLSTVYQYHFIRFLLATVQQNQQKDSNTKHLELSIASKLLMVELPQRLPQLTCHFVENVINSLWHNAKSNQKRNIVDFVISSFQWKAKQQSQEEFELEDQQKDDYVVEFLFQTSFDSDALVRSKALDCLSEEVEKFDEEMRSRFVEKILVNRICDKTKSVRISALKILTKMIGSENNSQIGLKCHSVHDAFLIHFDSLLSELSDQSLTSHVSSTNNKLIEETIECLNQFQHATTRTNDQSDFFPQILSILFTAMQNQQHQQQQQIFKGQQDKTQHKKESSIFDFIEKSLSVCREYIVKGMKECKKDDKEQLMLWIDGWMLNDSKLAEIIEKMILEHLKKEFDLMPLLQITLKCYENPEKILGSTIKVSESRLKCAKLLLMLTSHFRKEINSSSLIFVDRIIESFESGEEFELLSKSIQILSRSITNENNINNLEKLKPFFSKLISQFPEDIAKLVCSMSNLGENVLVEIQMILDQFSEKQQHQSSYEGMIRFVSKAQELLIGIITKTMESQLWKRKNQSILGEENFNENGEEKENQIAQVEVEREEDYMQAVWNQRKLEAMIEQAKDNFCRNGPFTEIFQQFSRILLDTIEPNQFNSMVFIEIMIALGVWSCGSISMATENFRNIWIPFISKLKKFNIQNETNDDLSESENDQTWILIEMNCLIVSLIGDLFSLIPNEIESLQTHPLFDFLKSENKIIRHHAQKVISTLFSQHSLKQSQLSVLCPLLIDVDEEIATDTLRFFEMTINQSNHHTNTNANITSTTKSSVGKIFQLICGTEEKQRRIVSKVLVQNFINNSNNNRSNENQMEFENEEEKDHQTTSQHSITSKEEQLSKYIIHSLVSQPNSDIAFVLSLLNCSEISLTLIESFLRKGMLNIWSNEEIRKFLKKHANNNSTTTTNMKNLCKEIEKLLSNKNIVENNHDEKNENEKKIDFGEYRQLVSQMKNNKQQSSLNNKTKQQKNIPQDPFELNEEEIKLLKQIIQNQQKSTTDSHQRINQQHIERSEITIDLQKETIERNQNNKKRRKTNT